MVVVVVKPDRQLAAGVDEAEEHLHVQALVTKMDRRALWAMSQNHPPDLAFGVTLDEAKPGTQCLPDQHRQSTPKSRASLTQDFSQNGTSSWVEFMTLTYFRGGSF
jgi:hypothetical protein